MFTFTFPVPSKGTLEKQHTTNNKNMAKILWHTKKATAGQDSSQFTLDGTKQTSGPSQTLFYQRRVWHYYSMNHLANHTPEVSMSYHGSRYCPWQ